MKTIKEWRHAAAQELQQAFPKANPTRIQDYLIRVSELYLQEVRKLVYSLPVKSVTGRLYHVRLLKLRNIKLQSEKKRVDLFQWILHSQNPLYQIKKLGSNIDGILSIIETNVEIPEPYDTFDNIKNQLDSYLSIPIEHLSDTDQNFILETIYGGHFEELETGECLDVSVDLKSLWEYLNPSIAKSKRDLKEAREIYQVARLNNSYLRQIRSQTLSPREYFKPPNLINCSKIVRVAALGRSHEYDLDSGSFRFFKWMLTTISKSISTTWLDYYLNNKTDVRLHVATLMKSFIGTDRDRLKRAKQVLTALSFGATVRKGWFTNEEEYKASALRKLLGNDHDNVLSDSSFVEPFISELRIIRNEIYAHIRTLPEWKNIPLTIRKKGKNSVLVYVYAQYESELIKGIVIPSLRAGELLLRVHDAIYTRNEIEPARMRQIESLLLKEYGGIPKLIHTDYST